MKPSEWLTDIFFFLIIIEMRSEFIHEKYDRFI